ncbi:alpha/beta fold hydrolase [Halopelagius fulvigenes]|uniref:Alpha/beta fold hydrolase n=1 Tax=Halopelagius fulvigenes TaxID=1198324 RepID=A0ABD5TXV4_9EURY
MSEREDASADAESVRRTRTTAADGRTVAYAEFGDAGGDPAFFFHGTPGSRLSGSLLAEAARERGVRLLCPDRPGIGGTDPLPEASLAERAADALAVADGAGVGSVPVLGFSGGAPHALALAATHPSRVSKLSLVCPPSPPDAPTGDTAAELRVLSALGRYAPFLLRPLLAAQARTLGDAPPETVASLYGDPDGVRAVVSDPEGVFETLAADFEAAFRCGAAGVARETRLFERPWGFDPGEVTVETAVRYGRADRNATATAARWLAERIPDAKSDAYDGDHLTAFLRARGDAVAELS